MKETIIIKNTDREIVDVTIDTTGSYISFSGSVYNLVEYDLEDLEMYAEELVNDTIEVDYFANNPDTTYNELIEELSHPYFFGNEVIEAVEFQVLGDRLVAWEEVGGGQIDPLREDLKEIWGKYHLKSEVSDTAEKEIKEVCNRIKQEVSQEYPF